MRPFLFRMPFVSLLVSLFSVPVQAQSAANAVRNIDESRRVVLHGTVHPLAQPQNDRGAVPDSFLANRMVVMLQPSPEREQSLQKFLRDAHAPGSPRFHHWVTPAEFGAQFGASDTDIATVSGWLQSHGFRIGKLASSKSHLEFSGTAAQVREALQTEIHEYNVEGNTHYAIANEASVPEQIHALIRGFAPLNTFPLASYVYVAGTATLTGPGHAVTPEFTTTELLKPFYAVAPEDFATQYNLAPLYAAGVDGTGQTIGILGRQDIDLGLISAYRTLFGLSGNNTLVVIDGEDAPSISLPDTEGYLDVEVSGAVARNATINFYTAGGTYFQDGLVLSTLRALEDNQASVLSASFGQCEPLTPNPMWNAFWGQAAAQGQTVLVSSGDSRPAACPLVLAAGSTQPINLGLTVNGLASTPWNIAVGGTDFYYSDYATGAPSITNDWNQTNDSSNGSLKAPLPEQPWDNSLGLNAAFAAQTGIAIIGVIGGAGGGGPSNCVVSTGTLASGITCVSGYPKPAWQNGPGVPGDAVRDLPDVSLFAATGENFSAYAICSATLDCAPGTAAPQVHLVGGTSASAPAMAGIMALLNQKYGRQGQANFTLYALAQQQPSIFHDITVGTNDTICDPIALSSACTTPVPGSSTLFSYGVYAAAPGYDMASGIGSFDANALVTNWNKITYQASSTSLQLSPASVTHGSPVNVTASVKASSGTTLPTGEVEIEVSGPVQLPPPSGVLQLASATATGSINTFPGGTYQVTAQYAGDGVFAPSTSAASTLTVTPEPSVLNLDVRYEWFNGTLYQVGIVQSGGQVPFGSDWTVEAYPTGQASNSTAPGTGTVTFTDGTTSVTVPLNSSGVATWSPADFSIGSHAISASYSGDASQNASTAGPFSFTVSQGNLRLLAAPETQPIAVLTTSPPSFAYAAGSSFSVYVSALILNSQTPPTGVVTAALGTATATGTFGSAEFLTRATSGVLLTFPNVPAGTYSLTVNYARDANWNPASLTYSQSLTFNTQQSSPSTISLSVSPSTINSGQAATFTATVQGPQGSTISTSGVVTLYANGVEFSTLAALPTPGSNTSTATLTVPGSALPAGNLQVIGVFEGSSGGFAGSTALAPSTSAPVSLTVNRTNFQMNLGMARLTIKLGSTGSVPLQLTGPSGGSVIVQLACAPSSSSFTCSVSPSSPTVNGSTTATVMINAYVMSTTTALAQPIAGFHKYSSATPGFLLGCVFLLFTPRKRLRSAMLMILVVCALTLGIGSCGGGGSSPPLPPPPQQINTPAGSYAVVVTAQSPSNTHNVKLAIDVQ